MAFYEPFSNPFPTRQSIWSRLDVARSKARLFAHLVSVVLLQDMRTRFGGSYLGYIIAILWPLTHLSVLVAAYYLRHTISPIGDSPTIFGATGAVPYILVLYPARMMGSTMTQNFQLLNIPLLRPLHIIVSRSILETLNALVVLALFLFGLSLADTAIEPAEPVEAAQAILAATYLGIGLGFLNLLFARVLGAFSLIFFNLLIIGSYLFSGVYLPVSAMPDNMRDYVRYNPIYIIVEWMRSAYYLGYEAEPVNKLLVIGVATVCLAIGLVGERYLRGKFVSAI